MPGQLSTLANGAHCCCSNNDALKFRRFHDREADEVLGLQCLVCNKEYLDETFVVLVDRKGHVLQPGRKRFYLAEKFHIKEDDVHMVHSAKTKIENVMKFGDYLKPADHIAWHRPWGYWHHAIVTEICCNQIRVVHWSSHLSKNPGPDCKIREELIDLKEESGSLWRMDYSEEIVKANPFRLVIARAQSRIEEKGYNLIRDNCETLASFCKYGVAISQQIVWACKELKNEVEKSGFATAAKIGIAEFAETISKQGQSVGFCLVVLIEGIHTCIDLKDIWKARQEGKITLKVAIEQIMGRLTQAVMSGSLAALGSMVPGTGFIWGFLGGIVGKWFGSMAGPHVGQFIANLIEYNDKAICNIEDLRSGDHLVLEYGSELSHHCIVQWYEKEINKINVIQITEDGIIDQELIDFVQPLYKVIYEEKDGHSPHDVWVKAVSMLGEKRYDKETFNSKHFAQLCSKKQ